MICFVHTFIFYACDTQYSHTFVILSILKPARLENWALISCSALSGDVPSIISELYSISFFPLERVMIWKSTLYSVFQFFMLLTHRRVWMFDADIKQELDNPQPSNNIISKLFP